MPHSTYDKSKDQIVAAQSRRAPDRPDSERSLPAGQVL